MELRRFLALGLLVVGCQKVEPPGVDLTRVLYQATRGPIVAPTEPLGSLRSRAFTGLGWEDTSTSGTASPALSSLFGFHPPELNFYLDATLPVQVTLEGKGAQQNVRAYLNGREWNSIAMNGAWKTVQLDASPEQLQSGRNRIELRETAPCQWKTFHVEARDRGQPTFEARADGNALLLPLAHSLRFALQLGPQSALTLENLGPWNEPGSAAVNGELTVRVRSEKPAFEKIWKCGPGKSRLALELPTDCQAELELRADASQPQPGQLGLRLTEPRVEGAAEPGLAGETAVPAGRPNRPNVILYLIDTLRSDHLGCYGYPHPTSPNLDKFRKEAVLFSDCNAQSAWTKPATASILCSMLPRQHQALGYADKLSSSAIPIAQLLAGAGYATRAIVTNPIVTAAFGFDRGFENFEYLGRADSQKVNHKTLPWLKDHGKDRPFFLYLHTREPHLPYAPPEKYLPPGPGLKAFGPAEVGSLLERAWSLRCSAHPEEPALAPKLARAIALYDGVVRSNDAAFGDLVDCLRQTGLYDNTMIVVVSDHGEEFLDHNYLGHGNSFYPELVRVPLLIKFPQSLGAGTRVDSTWQQIDVAPTILAELGIPLPPTMVGRAFAPTRPAGGSPRPVFFSIKTGVEMDGLRLGSWVCHQTASCLTYARLEPLQLFQLADDPQERKNLADAHPVLSTWMSALIRQARANTSPAENASSQAVDSSLRTLQYL